MEVSWIKGYNVNSWGVKSAQKRIEKCSEELNNFENEIKIAWLLKAVTFIDLTTLGGDDTKSNVTRLCLKAKNPIIEDILSATGFLPNEITTAAVCVYPAKVHDAVFALDSKNGDEDENDISIAVAAVATGFPSGQYSLETRLSEIKYAVRQGATEIDVVIDRSLVICGKWEELYCELKEMKKACGSAHMKTILAVGELPTLTDIYKASMIAMYAGSDFIKTSTGKETVNATVPFGIVMARAINDYYLRTRRKVGLKAAGGLKTANDALTWLVLVYEELGQDWLNKDLFRIGASSLLSAIETELYILIREEQPKETTFLPA